MGDSGVTEREARSGDDPFLSFEFKLEDHFVLRFHTDRPPEPVPVGNMREFLEGAHHVVVRQDQVGIARVSTVFLGLDHNWERTGALLARRVFGGEAPGGELPEPHVFETMIFGGGADETQRRCGTWAGALRQHDRACRLARRAQCRGWLALQRRAPRALALVVAARLAGERASRRWSMNESRGPMETFLDRRTVVDYLWLAAKVDLAELAWLASREDGLREIAAEKRGRRDADAATP